MIQWLGLAHQVETELRHEIDSRSLDRWDEDAISDSIIARIRRVLDGAQLEDNQSHVVAISTALYKARGKVENKYGDLALLLSFEFRDGTVLEGAAFYEAKLRDWHGTKLPSARKDQFNRLNRHLWKGSLLIYDRDPVPVPLQQLAVPGQAPAFDLDGAYIGWRLRPEWISTNAVSIPLNIVVATNRFDTSLYKFGHSFAFQVCLRNLLGLDLEHDPENLNAAKGQLTKYGVPKRLLVVAVRRGPGSGRPALPTVNENVLVPED